MDHLLVADKFEIDAVGVEQVGIGVFVAFALFDRIAFQLDHILVDVFRLGPAERHAVALEQEVRHPAFGPFGFVDDLDIGIDGLEQFFQRGTITVFGCLTACVFRADPFQVSGNIHKIPLLWCWTIQLSVGVAKLQFRQCAHIC